VTASSPPGSSPTARGRCVDYACTTGDEPVRCHATSSSNCWRRSCEAWSLMSGWPPAPIPGTSRWDETLVGGVGRVPASAVG